MSLNIVDKVVHQLEDDIQNGRFDSVSAFMRKICLNLRDKEIFDEYLTEEDEMIEDSPEEDLEPTDSIVEDVTPLSMDEDEEGDIYAEKIANLFKEFDPDLKNIVDENFDKLIVDKSKNQKK